MRIKHILGTIAAVAVPVVCQGQSYWFDDGTNEGWTRQVRSWSDSVATWSGSAYWDDGVNHPNTGGDTLGDDKGSIEGLLGPTRYEIGSEGEWVVVEFCSPDLTASTRWQAARSFSAQLLRQGFGCDPRYEEYPDFYANIWVEINDLDEHTTTYLWDDHVTLPNNEWTHLEFDLEGKLSDAGIVDYEVVQAIIVFWVEAAFGGIFETPDDVVSYHVDNVLPRILDFETLSISRVWDVDWPLVREF